MGNECCAECGMLVEENEFHPYAACLMFNGCHNGETVRANLAQFTETQRVNDEYKALLLEMNKKFQAARELAETATYGELNAAGSEYIWSLKIQKDALNKLIEILK